MEMHRLESLSLPYSIYNKSRKLMILLPLSLLVVIIGLFSYSYSIVDERFYLNGAVATDNKICSRIGVSILKDGGNAVDASVASAICLGTINAFASGIGGGGFALVGGASQPVQYFNFREKAPQSADPNMFVGNPMDAQIGAKSVGVPGELMGLWEMHIKYGKMEWQKLFVPSIRIAQHGFRVDKLLLKRLESVKKSIFLDPGFSSVYTKIVNNEKKLVELNDLITRPNYAKTLLSISESGIKSFYHGKIAATLTKFLRENGGILTMQDFGNYSVIVSDPLVVNYRGHKVYTTSLPSGGPVLAMMLKIMENYSIPSGLGGDIDTHRMIEAMKWGYAQRSFFGDPQFVPNVTEKINKILSSKYISAIVPRIVNDMTFEPEHYDSDYSQYSDHGTTHFSVVDKSGLAVSLTSTVNLNFGCMMMEPATGIILNDQLDDFSIPNRSNYFGLKPSVANYIAPGKRPQSSTAPTFLWKNGKLVLNIGGSGGSRIGTAVLQTIIRVIDEHIGMNHAIQMPRVHHQLFPNKLEVESTMDNVLILDLKAKNHTMDIIEKAFSAVQGIHVVNGKIYAGSDHRKDGEPAGY